LSHNWHAIFWKIFDGVNDIDCINNMGCFPLTAEIDARRPQGSFFAKDKFIDVKNVEIKNKKNVKNAKNVTRIKKNVCKR